MKSGEKELELIRCYLGGQASREEVAALESRMLEDPQLRRDFLAYARVDAALPVAIGEEAALDLVEQKSPRSRGGSVWLPWAAMVAVLIMGLLLGIQFRQQSAELTDPPPVARFGVLSHCRWTDPAVQVRSGDALGSGRRIELSSGKAEVLFNTGASMQLRGPAIVELRSGHGIFLALGQVHVVAGTPESKGFTVETPSSTFIDIGTAFSATVSPDGLSRLKVSQGEVDAIADRGDNPRRVGKGETLYVEPGERKIQSLLEPGDGTPAFRFPTIAPPGSVDYADRASGKASIRAVRGQLSTPARGKGAPLSVLLDGAAQSRQDAPGESAFFVGTDGGSFLLDLGEPVSITKINSYSWHQHPRFEEHRRRAQQQFTLYGYAGDKVPDLSLSPGQAGWTCIARVNSDEFFQVQEELDRPAQQACSIMASRGEIGRYRYLLWELRRNIFLGEIDVFAKP